MSANSQVNNDMVQVTYSLSTQLVAEQGMPHLIWQVVRLPVFFSVAVILIAAIGTVTMAALNETSLGTEILNRKKTLPGALIFCTGVGLMVSVLKLFSPRELRFSATGISTEDRPRRNGWLKEDVHSIQLCSTHLSNVTKLCLFPHVPKNEQNNPAGQATDGRHTTPDTPQFTAYVQGDHEVLGSQLSNIGYRVKNEPDTTTNPTNSHHAPR